MRAATKLSIAFLLLIVAISAVAAASAQSTAVSDAQAITDNAYATIVKADNAGADTTELITQLNQAINLTSQAQQLTSTNLQQAESLANQAKTLALDVTEQATAAEQIAQDSLPIVPISVAVACIVVGAAIYLLGPKAMWSLWFKMRKNYRVKTASSPIKNRGFFLTAEQLCAIVLGVAVIVAFLSVSGFLLPKNQGEQFSELGILGPNMQLGDYPSQVVASETVHLYGYVGNQMATPIYYTVMVKLGNNQTEVNPSPLTPVQQYSQVLANNQTWIFPLDVTLTQAGLNQRLIFELWVYNQTLSQNQYDQRWGQIWLNVTAPVH